MMKKIAILIILPIIIFGQPNTWYKPSLQPNGGNITYIEVDRDNPQNIYSVSNYSTIFFSSNGGDSWKEKDYQIEKISCIKKIPMSNSLLLGNYYHLYRSDNNGVSWEILDVPGLYRIDEIHIGSDPSLIYVYSYYAGLFRSSDGGKNWNKLFSLRGNYLFSALNDSIVIHYVYDTIRVSSDAGISWGTKITPGFSTTYILDALNDNVLYTSVVHGENQVSIYRSTNRGDSWAEINIGKGINMGISFIEDGKSILLSDMFEKSTDGGVSWTNYYFPERANYFRVAGNKIYAALYRYGIAVKEKGEWLYKNNNLKANRVFKIITTNRHLYFLTEAGTYKKDIKSTRDDWALLSRTLIFTNLAFLNDTLGFGYTNRSGKFYKTLNGGNSWGEIPLIGYKIHDIKIINQMPYLAIEGNHWSGDIHGIFRLMDNGSTWQLLIKGLNHKVIYDGNFLYGIKDTGGERVLHKSSDFGLTWNNVTVLAPGYNYTIGEKKDIPSGIIIGGHDQYYSNSIVYFLPKDSAITLLSFPFRVYKIAAPKNSEEFFISTLYPPSIYMAKKIGGEITEWTKGLPLSSLVSSISTIESDFYRNTIYTDRGGFMAIDISPNITSNITKIINESLNSYNLFQNYPNPFNSRTKIKYSISLNEANSEQENYTTLKIYDILGNHILTLVNEKQIPGEYEVELDAAALSSGVYFYTLSTGDFTATKKFVLMK